MQKRSIFPYFLTGALFLLCGCGEKKAEPQPQPTALYAGIDCAVQILASCDYGKKKAEPQPTTLYASGDYAMRICEDGTVEYLYQRDGFAEYMSGKTDEPFPTFSEYECIGIVEGDKCEDLPEIITRDGRFVSASKWTAAYWEEYLAHHMTSVSLEIAPIVRGYAEQWEDMVQLIGDSYSGYAMLRKDGTVVSTGIVDSIYEQELVEEDWTDIVHIVANDGMIYGLKQDGTICFSYNKYNSDERMLKKRLAAWKDIVQIAGERYLYGVKSDGTVCGTGSFYYFRQWTGITAIAVSDYAIVGIKEDGTLVAECKASSGFQAEEIADWDEIEQVAVCNEYCIAIRRDGTVLKTGELSAALADE